MNVLSLGVGVQSSTMLLMAAMGLIKPTPDIALFADTEAEPQGVYDYLAYLRGLMANWDGPHSIPIEVVSAGNLRADVMGGKKRIASPPFFAESANGGMLWRQCTQDYKIAPLTRRMRELAGYKPRQRIPDNTVNVMIGISTDEASRMKPARNRWQRNVWPLIDAGMARHDCLTWMDRHGFKLPAKSACTFCPYHSDAAWRDMKINDPHSFAGAVAVDEAIRDGVGGTKSRLYVHRSLVPLGEVDFRNLEDFGQLNMFDEECEGLCGV